jgi:single-strand DNA-binding protein
MNGITACLTGRVGGDPELKYTQAGKALLTFSVCADQAYTADEQRPAPEPLWVRVTIWETLAQELADQLHKGGSVYVEGRLKHDKWQGRDGEPRCGLNLSAWRCDLHGQIGKQASPRPKAQPAHAGAAVQSWAGWPPEQESR